MSRSTPCSRSERILSNAAGFARTDALSRCTRDETYWRPSRTVAMASRRMRTGCSFLSRMPCTRELKARCRVNSSICEESAITFAAGARANSSGNKSSPSPSGSTRSSITRSGGTCRHCSRAAARVPAVATEAFGSACLQASASSSRTIVWSSMTSTFMGVGPRRLTQARGFRLQVARLQCRGHGLQVEFFSGFDVVALEPALVHLEAELDGPAARVHRTLVERIHRVDFLQFAGRIEIADVQRQRRVAHPETLLLRAREDKEHALILPHGFAEHEALLQLGRQRGDLHLDGLAAELDREAVVDRLRPGTFRRVGTAAGGQQQGEAEHWPNRAHRHAGIPNHKSTSVNHKLPPPGRLLSFVPCHVPPPPPSSTPTPSRAPICFTSAASRCTTLSSPSARAGEKSRSKVRWSSAASNAPATSTSCSPPRNGSRARGNAMAT